MKKETLRRDYIISYVKGILAGFAISLGGIISLATKVLTGNAFLSAVVFTLGLILICNFNFNLYTGKICYLFNSQPTPLGKKLSTRILDLVWTLIGNFFGTYIFATLLKISLPNTSINELIFGNLQKSIEIKLNYNWCQTVGLSAFCGMLVFLAVDGFKKIENPIGKYIVLMLAISGFILCGFEHSIANMFYLFLNRTFSLQGLLFIILCIIGNSIGGLLFPLMYKI